MDEDSCESLEVTDLRRAGAPTSGRSPLDARLSPRRRAAQMATITGSVLLALCAALAAVPTVRQGATERLFGPPPTPTAPLAPGDDRFYVLPGPPWARITLDGRPLAHPPVPGAGRPLRLARGRHALTWQAAPFQSWRCTISVPVSGSDTCPYDRGYQSKPGTGTFWILLLYPSASLLPDDQWSALIGAIQATLDAERSSDVVRPGEAYATAGQPGFPQVRTADQSLRATLKFHLLAETPASRPAVPNCSSAFIYIPTCTFLGQNCLLLCSVPEPGAPAYWSVLAPVYGSWDYVTPAGRPVASDQPDGEAGILTPLRITRDDAGWHVALAPAVPALAYTSLSPLGSTDQTSIGSPACAGLESPAETGAFALSSPSVPDYTALGWGYASGAPLAAGCLGVATPLQPADSSPGETQPPAYVLQRFGVVLAANAAARQAWPDLPVADVYEQALARQLAAAAT